MRAANLHLLRIFAVAALLVPPLTGEQLAGAVRKVLDRQTVC